MKYEKLARDGILDLIASDIRIAGHRTATIVGRDSYQRTIVEALRAMSRGLGSICPGGPGLFRKELAVVREAIEGIGQLLKIDPRSIREAARATPEARGRLLSKHLSKTRRLVACDGAPVEASAILQYGALSVSRPDE